MILLTKDEILELHAKLMARTGGRAGLRDAWLLEAAVCDADSWGCVCDAEGNLVEWELYPTVEEKAARLMRALTFKRAFVDGNKRTGLLVMLMTLKLNGVALRCTQAELIGLSLSTASGEMKCEAILDWILAHRA